MTTMSPADQHLLEKEARSRADEEKRKLSRPNVRAPGGPRSRIRRFGALWRVFLGFHRGSRPGG